MSNDAQTLVQWYRSQRRDLPWRLDRNPYRIWVSEVMLQQTTVVAVIPFFERFLKRFPNLHSLADAPLEDVIAQWAGLGYYSRARNLHKAAQALAARGGFPPTFEELLELPGFGPYTARAVASLAFDQRVGVLDGNVIRVLSRRHGLDLQWWKPRARAQLQELSDELAQAAPPADVNQGLMELGATVCTPQNPACLLCPWTKVCVALRKDRVGELPLKRPRRERENWIWQPLVIERRGQVALIENSYAPFLKGHWICPGRATRVAEAPKKYDYRHAVTHHDIFVRVDRSGSSTLDARMKVKWVPRRELKKWIPTTLVRKAIEGV